MRRFLGAAVATSLALIQPASVVEAYAQSFSGAASASEGVGAIHAVSAPAAISPVSGLSSPLSAGVSLVAGAPALSAPSPASVARAQAAAAASPAAATPAAAVAAAAQASAAALPAAASLAAPAADATAPLAASAAAADVPAAAAAAPSAPAPTGLRGLIASARARLFPSKSPAEAALAKTFDGSAAAQPATESPVPASAAALPSGRIRAYLVHPGQKPVMITLEELPEVAAKSGFAADFNKNGHLRVVLGEGALEGPTLAESDVAGLKTALAAGGLNVSDARARTDSIPMKTAVSSLAASAAAAQDAGRRRAGRAQLALRVAVGIGVAALYVAHFGAVNPLAPVFLAFLVANVDRAVRETAYSLGMLRTAFKESKHPRWNEVVGGVIGKIIPAIVNLGIFAAMYHGHPIALAMAAGLSLAVETFHGVWVNAWDTFQSKMGRHRGMLYQNIFNFIYGQLISGGFRTITYFTLGNVPPPWSIEYWKAVSAMTLIGTFCGTLGYRGLNSIYEKGRIPRWGRAGIQQLRDFCMMMIGPFFGTGNMFMTWLLFGIMQSVDLAIYAVDRALDTRPIIYLADERVAQSDMFKAIYIDRPSPLTEAVNGVKNSMFAKPFVALYRRIAGRARGPQPTR